MSRQARQFSETGLYHIVFRGVNYCHLFEEDADYDKMLSILKQVKNELQFKVYAYCFMSNHVHLFLHETNVGDIVKIMRKVLTHYVGWFNRKYKRSGALIANRYKSECINDDKYLFSLVRYVHNNPVKAGIVEKAEGYKWSSFEDYTSKRQGITDTAFILGIIDTSKKRAIKAFAELHEADDNMTYIPTDKKRKSEEQIRRIIIEHIGGEEPSHIATLDRVTRNKTLMELAEKGLSIRQLERATGISRGVIQKCCHNRTVPK